MRRRILIFFFFFSFRRCFKRFDLSNANVTGRGGFIALVEFGKPDTEKEKDISRTITALRKVFLLSLEGFFDNFRTV